MAIYDFPSDIRVGPVDYGVRYESLQITVARNGRVQTYSLPGDGRWVCSIRFENDIEQSLMRGRIEAFIVKLGGGEHWARFGHLARPRPNGTLRGNPTLGVAALAGATQLTLVNVNGNLKRGDLIGLPGQMVMVVDDANPVLTNLVVNVKPAIRAAHNSGTPVTWNKPTTTWIPDSNVAGPFPYLQNGVRPAFSYSFIEVW